MNYIPIVAKKGDCSNCGFASQIGLYLDRCTITGIDISNTAKDFNPDKDCPIIELKPKELEWNFDGEIHTAKIFGDIEISFVQLMNGKSKIYIESREYKEHYYMRNSELKQLCQDHYNKLFYEMIGGQCEHR